MDAAIEVLKGQAPGRGVHVRQIADSAVRRRLIHGEPNEAWRVMRAALASESKERLRAGARPRIKSAGSGLYALSRRVPDADLEKAEFVFGEACRALRERTLAALEQRLAELAPASFEAVARVVLQREGFGPATFVKRVEGTIYVEALRVEDFGHRVASSPCDQGSAPLDDEHWASCAPEFARATRMRDSYCWRGAWPTMPSTNGSSRVNRIEIVDGQPWRKPAYVMALAWSVLRSRWTWSTPTFAELSEG